MTPRAATAALALALAASASAEPTLDASLRDAQKLSFHELAHVPADGALRH
jgi:hypothetical protein